MLYVGLSLMIGAGIYGFIDYHQARGKEQFENLYEKEAENVMIHPVDPGAGVGSSAGIKGSGNEGASTAAHAPTTGKGDRENIVTENVETGLKEPEEPVKSVKRKKKIDHRNFSRAPLRPEMEETIPETPDSSSVRQVKMSPSRN